MAEFNPTLAILLSDKPLETDPRKVIITPLSAGESWLATIGLKKRLNDIHRDLNRPDNDRPAQEIYGPLFEHIDEYRQRAINFSEALSPINEIQPDSRAFVAEHIALLMHGQLLHRKGGGKWPSRITDDERVLENYMELLETDNNDFQDKKIWAYQRARNNNIFWIRELQHNRGHRLAIALRAAGVMPAATTAEV
jgi:hypothetical protein